MKFPMIEKQNKKKTNQCKRQCKNRMRKLYKGKIFLDQDANFKAVKIRINYLKSKLKSRERVRLGMKFEKAKSFSLTIFAACDSRDTFSFAKTSATPAIQGDPVVKEAPLKFWKNSSIWSRNTVCSSKSG